MHTHTDTVYATTETEAKAAATLEASENGITDLEFISIAPTTDANWFSVTFKTASKLNPLGLAIAFEND